MIMGYVTQGDTIRLNSAFETFAGVGSDPTTVTLDIYDELRNNLLSASTTTGVTNGSTDGAFYYDYTTVNAGVHFYEFEGALEGHTISDKGTFYVTWA
jgi:hypothetical protein